MEPQILHIMENFDFKTVRKVMKALNWKWAIDEDTRRVPKLSELRYFALNLLVDLLAENHPYIKSGGFMASREGRDLELTFCVAEWDTETLHIEADLYAGDYTEDVGL